MPSPLFSQEWQYKSISTSSEKDDERKDLETVQSRFPFLQVAIPWTLTAILLLIVIVDLASPSLSSRKPKQGFHADVQDVQCAISYHQYEFDSALFYNDTSEALEMHKDPQRPRYVGEPSDEIDAAWEDMMNGMVTCTPVPRV